MASVAWTWSHGRVYAVARGGPRPFTVIALSETASSIWTHIEGNASVSSIIDGVAAEWSVGTDEVADGVRSFLRQLTDQHLVGWDAQESHCR
ncbi:PqqD family protein [Microbacterium enclense]|uniref:PqqD family protein n=1 Tax=Microbacterium enclense TaxID=993073 RepID=UPI003D7041B9